MKVLEFCLKKLEIVGFDSDRNPFNQRVLMVFSVCCISNISAGVYLFHDANNFMAYSLSIYVTTTIMLIIFCYTILITQIEDTFDLIDNFECTIEKRLRFPASKVIYENANRQAGKWSSIVFITIANVTPVCNFLPVFMGSFFMYFTTDLGNDAFKLPFPLWFPFDYESPNGFCMAISLLYLSYKIMLTLVACLFCYGASAFLTIIAVIKDAQIALNSMKSNLRTESGGRQQMMEELLDFIKLQLMAKQAVHDASNISESFLTALFAWSVITICSTLLMLQIGLSQSDTYAFVITVLCAAYSFGMLFVVCEIAND